MSDAYGFRFRDWDIYKDALKLRREVYGFIKDYPKEETYALSDQTKRALSSIVLNIAEGANRSTDKDMRIYITRAHGSLDEVVACMDCASDNGYLKPEQHTSVLNQAASLAKRLRQFAVHLSSPR